jgi:hypothetical protein
MGLAGMTTESGLIPEAIDRKGPLYSMGQVMKYIHGAISTEDFYTRKARNMTKDAEKAIEMTDDVAKRFKSSINQLMVVEQEFVQQSKKMSGEVRDASEKIAQGIQRVEKAANFERLERYVELLERTATAMTILGELEKTGKLDKIATAIR